LNLLSSLCSCNDEAIPTNQDDICTLLLEEEEFDSILMKVETKRGNGMQRIHEIAISDNPKGGNKEKDGDNEPTLFLDVDKICTYFQ